MMCFMDYDCNERFGHTSDPYYLYLMFEDLLFDEEPIDWDEDIED